MAIQIKNVGNPVVFTNNAGGGGAEIQVPPNGEASMELHAEGGTVREAWYSPCSLVLDMTGFLKGIKPPTLLPISIPSASVGGFVMFDNAIHSNTPLQKSSNVPLVAAGVALSLLP